MPVDKTAAVRQRRAEDTRRWRERLERGAAVYPVEVDGTTFDLMERFGGAQGRQDWRPAGCCRRSRQVAAPRVGGVAAGRRSFPALAMAFPHKPGLFFFGANRTRRDGGNDVNDPKRSRRARRPDCLLFFAASIVISKR